MLALSRVLPLSLSRKPPPPPRRSFEALVKACAKVMELRGAAKSTLRTETRWTTALVCMQVFGGAIMIFCTNLQLDGECWRLSRGLL